MNKPRTVLTLVSTYADKYAIAPEDMLMFLALIRACGGDIYKKIASSQTEFMTTMMPLCKAIQTEIELIESLEGTDTAH